MMQSRRPVEPEIFVMRFEQMHNASQRLCFRAFVRRVLGREAVSLLLGRRPPSSRATAACADIARVRARRLAVA